jgi:hypothetical protein
MGDILSLVEEARKGVDEVEAKKLAEKFKKGKGFDLEDFKGQLQQMKKMGGLASLVDKLPAQIAQAAASSPQLADDRALRRLEGIINSMTPAERAKPEIIKASRKRRIATGAGVPVQEVNRLLNQFGEMQKMTKQMQKASRQDDVGDEGRFPGSGSGPKSLANQSLARVESRPFRPPGHSFHGCDSPCSRRRQEAAVLQHRRRRLALRGERPVHRAHRLLRSEGARRPGELPPQRRAARPLDRPRREALADRAAQVAPSLQSLEKAPPSNLLVMGRVCASGGRW